MSNIITPYVLIGILGEAIVSVYPFLIKATTIDIPAHTFIRLSSYFAISSVFANYKLLSNINPLKLLGLALVNIAHILTSYYGFRLINPSLAQSIFYIYPFFNLFLNMIILNYKVSYTKFIMLIPVVYSIYSIYSENGDKHEGFTNMSNRTKGIILIILAAVTESLLYLFVKTTNLGDNPWTSVLTAYGLAAILYGIYYLYNKRNDLTKIYNDNKKELLYVVLANMFIASFGYGFRFLSIPKVEPVIFSMLSYTGIFMAIIYGLLFKLEIMSIRKVASLFILFVSLIIFQRL
jgi:drug/metabolite transporter (DMT)-like permease